MTPSGTGNMSQPNASTTTTPRPGAWARFSSATASGFRRYAEWLVSITWKKFFLLSLLLLIAAGILSEIPPFSTRFTVSTDEPAVAPAKPASKERKRKGSVGDVDIKIDGTGIHIKRNRKAVPQPPQAGPGYRRVRLRLHQRVSDYAAEYSVDSGDRSMWSFSLLGEDSSEGIDRQKALEIATKAAQPPADAVLESAEYEVQGDASVFSARWVHVHQGMPVENDFIMVLVNGATGRPFVLHRCWHTVDEKPSWR